jgi:hypothetical protein
MKNKHKPDLDLQDSEDDKKHLQPQETTIDLPDVEDIPGQEHIKVPGLSEFADTTASSAGEEGDSVFNNAQSPGKGSNVSASERKLLQKSADQMPDDESEEDVREAALDSTDEEGAPLNEGNLETDRFGEDLDLPESEEVDEEE